MFIHIIIQLSTTYQPCKVDISAPKFKIKNLMLSVYMSYLLRRKPPQNVVALNSADIYFVHDLQFGQLLVGMAHFISLGYLGQLKYWGLDAFEVSFIYISSCQCYLPAENSASVLHNASSWALGFLTTWQLGSQGSIQRRESQAEPFLPLMILSQNLHIALLLLHHII